MKITNNNYMRTSDNAFIYFEDYGGTGEPIMLLHGFMLSTELYHKSLPALNREHRVILVDWRGHGNSSKTTSNLTMARAALDIKELIEYLELENLHLFASSMGASVVMQYYESFGAAHLKSIGFFDSYLYPFSYEDWNTHALKGFNIVGMMNSINNCTLDRDTYTRNFAKSLFPVGAEVSEEDITFVMNQAKKIPAWVAFPIYNDFLLENYLGTLAKISIPLYIGGADSPIVRDGVRIAHHYASLCNTKHHVEEYIGDGHIMYYTNPDYFSEKLLAFIEQ